MDKRIIRLFFFLGVIVALVGSFFLLTRESIRLDESQSVWVSIKSLPTIFSITSQDVHVPLYFVLLHYWILLFGTSTFSIRMLSFLFFLLTLPFLYQLAKEIGGRVFARASVVLFSLSPFMTWYSFEARMYSLFAFIAILNHTFFLRFFDTRGREGKLGYLITSVVGLYTHYFFLFLLFAQLAFVVYKYFATKKQQFSEQSASLSKRFFAVFVLLLVASGIFFIPWIIYFFSSGAGATMQPKISPPTSFNIFQVLTVFIFGFQNEEMQSIFIASWPLLIVVFFLLFMKRRNASLLHSGYFLFVTFLPVVAAFLVSFVRPIFLSRYLIFVTPTLYFLIAWMLLDHTRRASRFIVILFFLLIFGLQMIQNFSESTSVKEHYEEATKYLEENASASDVIAVSAPFTIYPIEYYYQGPARITTIPQWNRYAEGAIPSFSANRLVSQIREDKKTYTKMFVVFSYDQGYEKNIKEYLDTHYQLLDQKVFSPAPEVRVYLLRYDVPQAAVVMQ